VWVGNPTGSLQMDAVNGLAVDYARNLVFVVNDHSPANSQNTVWAFRTRNGLKLWGVDIGAIGADPVLGNSGL